MRSEKLSAYIISTLESYITLALEEKSDTKIYHYLKELNNLFLKEKNAKEIEETLGMLLVPTIQISQFTGCEARATVALGLKFLEYFPEYKERLHIIENQARYFPLARLISVIDCVALRALAYRIIGDAFFKIEFILEAFKYYQQGLWITESNTDAKQSIEILQNFNFAACLCRLASLQIAPMLNVPDLPRCNLEVRKQRFFQHNRQWQALWQLNQIWQIDNLNYDAYGKLFNGYISNLDILFAEPTLITTPKVIEELLSALNSVVTLWCSMRQPKWSKKVYSVIKDIFINKISKNMELKEVLSPYVHRLQDAYKSPEDFDPILVKADVEEKFSLDQKIKNLSRQAWMTIQNDLKVTILQEQEEKKDILAAQCAYNNKIIGLLQLTINNLIIPLLGEPPPLQILLTGSLVRQQVSLVSDIDLEILVFDQDEAKSLGPKDEDIIYAEKCWALLRYFLLSLGLPGIVLEKELKEKIHSPQTLFAEIYQYNTGGSLDEIKLDLLKISHACLHLRPLFSTRGGEKLWLIYQKRLMQWMEIPKNRKLAASIPAHSSQASSNFKFEEKLYEIEEAVEQGEQKREFPENKILSKNNSLQVSKQVSSSIPLPKHAQIAQRYLKSISLETISHKDIISIKKNYLEPLYQIISYWALYYGLTEIHEQESALNTYALIADSEKIIENLSSQGYFTPAAALILQSSLRYLLSFRLRIHSIYLRDAWVHPQQDRDAIYFPSLQKLEIGLAIPLSPTEEKYLLAIEQTVLSSLSATKKQFCERTYPVQAWDLFLAALKEAKEPIEFAKNLLRLLVLFKLEVAIHRYYYFQILKFLWDSKNLARQTQVIDLAKDYVELLKTENFHHIALQIGEIALPNGSRFVFQEREQKWRETLLNHLLVPEETPEAAAQIQEHKEGQGYKKQSHLMQAETEYLEQNLPLLLVETFYPAGDLKEKKLSESLGIKRLIRPDIAACLISPINKWKQTDLPGWRKTDLPGRRIVIAYPDAEKPLFYFKILPELVGNEYSVHELCQRVIGYGTPCIQLIKLTLQDAKTKKSLSDYPLPILISEAIVQSLEVKGQHLESALIHEIKERKDSHDIKKSDSFKLTTTLEQRLNDKAFTQMVLLAILTQPEDGTAHNFVLCEDQQNKKDLRLISIDNDHSWVQAFAKKSRWRADQAHLQSHRDLKLPQPQDEQATIILQVKTIIYCLDAMKKPLNQEAIEEFLYLDSDVLLTNWLDALKNIDEHLKFLFPPDIEKYYLQQSDPQKFAYMRPIFGQETIAELYQTWYRLRLALQDVHQPPHTHLDLLQRVHPLIGRRYRLLHHEENPYNSPIQRMKQLTDTLKQLPGWRIPSSICGQELLQIMDAPEQVTMDKRIRRDKMFDSGKALLDLKRFIDQYQNLLQTSEQLKNNVIAIAAIPEKIAPQLSEFKSYLVEAIPFANIHEVKQHRAIIDTLSGGSYSTLAIYQAQLPSNLHQVLIKSVNLRVLNLRGCMGVNSRLLELLSIHFLMLEILILSDSSLNAIGSSRLTGFSMLEFTNLLHLEINRCQQLREVHLSAPKLIQYQNEDCKNLHELRLNVPHLTNLRLKGTAALNRIEFVNKTFANFMLWQKQWLAVLDNPKMARSLLCLGLIHLLLNEKKLISDFTQAEYWWQKYKKYDSHHQQPAPLLIETYGLIRIHKMQRDDKHDPTAGLPLLQLHIELKQIPQRQKQVAHLWLLAAKNGFLTWMQCLLRYNKSSELWTYRDESGNTALHLAIATNKVQIIEFYYKTLEKKVMHTIMRMKGSNGRTPFLMAAYYGQKAMMEFMLTAYVESTRWDDCDDENQTALHLVITESYTHESVIALCLQSVALKKMLQIHDINGNTPFLVAVSHGYDLLVRMMLEQEPSLWQDQNTETGCTALHLALIGNKKNILDLCNEVKTLNLSARTKQGFTPFLIAIVFNHEQWLRDTLNRFPQYHFEEEVDIEKNTFLHLAMIHRDSLLPFLFDKLVPRKPSLITHKNNQGRNLLHLAVEYGRSDWIQPLIKKYKLQPNEFDQLGETPMSLAARGQNQSILNKLLDCGAQLDGRTLRYYDQISIKKQQNEEKKTKELKERKSDQKNDAEPALLEEEIKKSIQVFNHAIKENPESVNAYIGRGATYLNAVKIKSMVVQQYALMERALQDYEKALSLDPMRDDIARVLQEVSASLKTLKLMQSSQSEALPSSQNPFSFLPAPKPADVQEIANGAEAFLAKSVASAEENEASDKNAVTSPALSAS